MKSWLYKLGVMLFCVLFLTGCVKYNVNMTINSDKSMKLVIKYGIDFEELEKVINETLDEENTDDELQNEEETTGDEDTTNDEEIDTNDDETDDEEMSFDMTDIITDEELERYKKNGFSVEEFKEENYTGFILTKEIANIDDVTSQGQIEAVTIDSLVGDSDTEPAKYYFYKDSDDYVANFIFKVENLDGIGIDTSATDSSVDMTYSVILPNKSISNNATKVSDDGKELTWTLDPTKESNIEYKFNFGKSGIIGFFTNTDNLMYMAGVILIILALALLIWNSKRNAKSKVENTATTNEGTSPVNSASVTPTPTPAVPTAPVAPTPTPVVPTTPVAPTPTPVVPTTPVAPTSTESAKTSLTPTLAESIQSVQTTSPPQTPVENSTETNNN